MSATHTWDFFASLDGYGANTGDWGEPGTDGVIYARTGTVWEWVEMDLFLEMNEDPYHWRLPTDL
jgi:hypothetical protein